MHCVCLTLTHRGIQILVDALLEFRLEDFLEKAKLELRAEAKSATGA